MVWCLNWKVVLPNFNSWRSSRKKQRMRDEKDGTELHKLFVCLLRCAYCVQQKICKFGVQFCQHSWKLSSRINLWKRNLVAYSLPATYNQIAFSGDNIYLQGSSCNFFAYLLQYHILNWTKLWYNQLVWFLKAGNVQSVKNLAWQILPSRRIFWVTYRTHTIKILTSRPSHGFWNTLPGTHYCKN